MNLIININTELHSVKASAMGEAKTHSAIKEAIDEIILEFQLPKENTEVIKNKHWDLGHGWSDEF